MQYTEPIQPPNARSACRVLHIEDNKIIAQDVPSCACVCVGRNVALSPSYVPYVG